MILLSYFQCALIVTKEIYMIQENEKKLEQENERRKEQERRKEEIKKTEVPTAGENITPKTGQTDKFAQTRSEEEKSDPRMKQERSVDKSPDFMKNEEQGGQWNEDQRSHRNDDQRV